VSAVGAGDAMLAGLVLALSRGDSLEDAMRYAMATGAAATLREGTQLVRQADVERLLT
jgi:6-phosphofructokinase 2